ncbi:MAG: hypothetical protein HND57_17015 [Planctomycetes bacterium]|nr:hypothetical protein [Planctomycetota bacterium]
MKFEELPEQAQDELRHIVLLPLMDAHSRISGLSQRISRLSPRVLGELALEVLADLLETKDGRARLADEDPDSMHNLATHAARLGRSDLEERLLKVFVQSKPRNVDLHADLLQFYHGKRWRPDLCEEHWQAMNHDDIPKEVREQYWRYWVYGAIYHAKVKRDLTTARQLLIDGLERVNGSEKAQVLGAFERVMIDYSPSPQYVEVVEQIEKYIKSGARRGYTLACKLAELLQEQAFVQEGGKETPEGRRLLQRALGWLSIAESSFTNDGNHPIKDIYRPRINILMGLGDYREAIDYMLALYESDREEVLLDSNLKAQFVLACQREGELDLWRKYFGKEHEQEAEQDGAQQQSPSKEQQEQQTDKPDPGRSKPDRQVPVPQVVHPRRNITQY